MKIKKRIIAVLLLSLLVFGLSGFSSVSFADKKAVEGQNEADVEFYEPTPQKPDPKPKPKPDPKPDPISKILPKTGEKDFSQSVIWSGIGIISFVVIVFLKMRKVGEINEN